MHCLEIYGLLKALFKFKDFSRQAVKFKGFSILYENFTLIDDGLSVFSDVVQRGFVRDERGRSYRFAQVSVETVHGVTVISSQE